VQLRADILCHAHAAKHHFGGNNQFGDKMTKTASNAKPRILFISALNPLKGSAILGWDYYMAFKQQGYDIDFLTRKPVGGHPELISVLNCRRSALLYLRKLWGQLRQGSFKRQHPLDGYSFFYKNDKEPPVPTWMVLSRIRKQYDIVMVLFWNKLISAATLDAIFEQQHAPMFMIPVDYSPMTGGCHFPVDCDGYQHRCGKCKAWQSENPIDFTRQNMEYREHVYSKIKPVFFMNSFMRERFYAKSSLTAGHRIEDILLAINDEQFRPLDRSELRQKYGIPATKKFIAFFGSQYLSTATKGMKYLMQALGIWYEALTPQQRDEVMIVSAGHPSEQISGNIRFDYQSFGYVDFSVLPELYALADVYLSPPVFDAGPMMVNQAMSCGTPVVAFEVGTAMDVIKNQGTGYCAKLKDVNDFAKGIDMLYRLGADGRKPFSDRCRKFALANTSYRSCVDKLMAVYRGLSKE
jgi:glycosyltransferase involved in cell wall biosynthesis